MGYHQRAAGGLRLQSQPEHNQPKTVTPAHRGYLFGLNLSGNGGFGPYLDAVRAVKPSVVVITDEDKAVSATRDVSPDTTIIFRRSGLDFIANPGYAAGVERANLLLPGWKGIPADYYCLANEWTPDHDVAGLRAVCDTYRGAMDTANRLGVKITVGDFSTGQPRLEDEAVYDALRPMFAQAAVWRHALNFHIYNPAHFERWKRVMQEYPDLRVIVGEYSTETGTPTGEAFQRLLSDGRALFGPWPQIIGAALYEVRPINPVNFEVDLAEYMTAAQTQTASI